MANHIIGEVDLVWNGRPLKMRFGSFAIAELETKLGRPLISMAEELDNPEKRFMKTIVTALWAMLQEYQPEDQPDGITMRQAHRIIDDLGLQHAGEKVAECMNMAFPDAGEVAEGAENPPNRKKRRVKAARERA